LAAVLAIAGTAPAAEFTVRDEIFGSKEAADMVRQARTYDPMYAKTGVDRGKAIELYEKAISLQPDAPMNACLANRIAQLYAIPYDPKRGTRPDRAKAVEWWRRCTEYSNPCQLLWAQAHMGIGCTMLLGGKPETAADEFETILGLDILDIKWPAWRKKPDLAHPAGRENYEREMIRLRDEAEKISLQAVDKVHYALVRWDGAEAAKRLARIAREYEGLPVGDRAQQLARQALAEGSRSVFRSRELARTPPDDVLGPPAHACDAKGTPAAASSPPLPRRKVVQGRAPVPSATEPPDSGDAAGPLRLVGLCVGVLVVVAVFLLVRRTALVRRRL
jgi:tetratricopeptide (TPR) repeat protein